MNARAIFWKDDQEPGETPEEQAPKKVRGRPFEPGNPGRPVGAKNRIARLLEQMVGNEAEKLTRKGIDRALGGDSRCLNINKSLERALIEGTIQYENFSNYRAALDHYSSRIDLTGMVRRILRNRSYKSYGRIPHHLITEIADESLNPALHPATWIRR